MGYGHPQDNLTQNCAGWARGPQNLWQLHRISGSKSRSANDGSSSVVTAPKAKVKVESFAGGAREDFCGTRGRVPVVDPSARPM